MRITFLTHFPGRGGSTSTVLQLVRFFRSRGHDTTVVVGQDCPAPVLDKYIVFSTKAIDWRLRLRDYRTLVEDTKPDVLYYVSGIEEADLLRFLKCVRVRHVFTLERHEMIDVPYWLKQLALYWEACTANTPDVLEEIQTHHPRNYQALLVPYDVDPAFRFLSLADPQGDRSHRKVLSVCYVGRFERYQKRVHWIPEIVQRCRDAGQQFEWHLYGEGSPEGAMLDELSRRNCADVVRFHGWVEGKELAKQLVNHDIFFSCSRFEGLPLAMVEAMFCGLACVVPDIPGGIRHLITQGGGWGYDAGTPRMAAAALLAAAKNRRVLECKQDEARRTILQLCGSEAVERHFHELECAIQKIRFNGRVAGLETAPRIRLVRLGTFIKRQFMRKKLVALLRED